MNLLNLILIVIIITIDPIMRIPNFAWDGLVFIKPENLTKTEWVEKFKELSSSKTLKDLKKEDDEDKITTKELLKSSFLKLFTFFSKFKKLIMKITLFSILIKYFRIFKLIRFIWSLINSVLLSTFGIVFSDLSGFKEIFAHIEYYWIEYVNFIHRTKIYKILIKLFNEIKESEDNSNLEINKVKSEKVSKPEIIENKSESKINNSEINEFPSSGRELKEEKIVPDKTSWGNIQEKWFQLDKYFWIGLSIVSLTLIYYNWDFITQLFKNVKPDNDGSTTSDTPIFLDPQEEYNEYFKEISTNEELYDLEQIRDSNKGKTIEYTEVENARWEDSPTTPKASSSELPLKSDLGVMLPISKK